MPEQRAVFAVCSICKIDLSIESTGDRADVQIHTAVTYMRRSFELFTLQHLVFIAPLIAGRSASVAAKCTAVCPAACVVHIAGIDVRTGVGVILDHVAVTLYLTFDGRRSFS